MTLSTAFGRWLRRARGSVRVRVTLLAAGAFAVAFVVAAVLFVRSVEQGLVSDVEAAAETRLALQEEELTEHGPPADARIYEVGDVATMHWSDGDSVGYVLALPTDADLGDVFPDDASAAAVAAVAEDVVAAGGGGDGEWEEDLAGLLDVPDGVEAITSTSRFGPGLLATSSPLDDVRAAIGRTTRALWYVGPGLVALVAALAWLLTGRALHPVRTMTARVAAIERGSLQERVPEPPTDDEIAALARTMNEMLGRLDASNEASRRLVSDASHELRTPIAVLRTELEVASADPGNDWSETATTALAELGRLSRLVDDLLLLARGDERPPTRGLVDLADIARETAARRQRAEVAVTVDIVDDPPPALPVTADRGAVERAVDHVVANAVRSARSSVVITAVPAEATIHVDDDGPGIPPDQREDVVKRFVRLDEGRGRDDGGAGLGLAVASEVAAAHGGELAIGDAPLGGARVSISLGASEPPASGGGSRATM